MITGIHRIAFAVGLALAAAVAPAGSAQVTGTAAKSATSAVTQRSFAAPEDAAKALADTVRAADADGLIALVGSESHGWLFTGDKVADRADWNRFLAAYDRKRAIAKEGEAKAILNVGEDNWSFPAPIVKRGSGWVFDAEAGREEVTNRRVGRNELDTIQTLLAIVDAQREYSAMDRDGDDLTEYAKRFVASPGKKDGLYWPTKEGQPQSPLGPLVASATTEGYGDTIAKGKPRPYHGYNYRMLSAQGKDAAGGAYDYVVKDRLIGGFAIVAWPASYDVSGVKTFIVNHDGVVYEKDLGPTTAAQAGGMTSYNPGKTWERTKQK